MVCGLLPGPGADALQRGCAGLGVRPSKLGMHQEHAACERAPNDGKIRIEKRTNAPLVIGQQLIGPATLDDPDTRDLIATPESFLNRPCNCLDVFAASDVMTSAHIYTHVQFRNRYTAVCLHAVVNVVVAICG